MTRETRSAPVPDLGSALVSAAGIAVLWSILPWTSALTGSVLTVMLVWLSAIDARTQLLPDALTLPLALLGIVLALTGLGPGVPDALAGAALGYGIIFVIAVLYRYRRGIEAIGLGDAKLLAALGAWDGALMLPFIVFCASVSGIVFYLGRGVWTSFSLSRHIAFGPFLALAGAIAFICLHRDIEPMQTVVNQLVRLLE